MIISVNTKNLSNQNEEGDTILKGLTKLEKYLYLQHGKCFYCREDLALEDASIEHLNPTSKGGTKTENNEVACCATVNHTFGDMDLKRKFEFILKSSTNFKCPKKKQKSKKSIVPKRNKTPTSTTTPANHGMPWTEKEETQLLSRYSQKLDIEDIANRHKRVTGEVRARLVKLGKIEEEENQA